jgi:hypothetical protein
MALQKLVGRQVVMSISDPWDFCSEHGTVPFPATVESASGEELLLRLRAALAYKETVFDRLVATARHENEPLSAIGNTGTVSVNLTPVPAEAAGQADDAFVRVARWRGWHLIATLSAP